MKSIDEAEAQVRLNEILEEAQRQPIVIRRQGQDTAVVVSIADYERLHEAKVRALLDLRKTVAVEAEANRLTEEELARLLSADNT